MHCLSPLMRLSVTYMIKAEDPLAISPRPVPVRRSDGGSNLTDLLLLLQEEKVAEMDRADLTTPAAPMELGVGAQTSASRPSLGFPLGTVLLLIVIFCLSGVFSCCYHWDKLRSLRGHPRNHVHEADHADVEHHFPQSLLLTSPLTLKLASEHEGYKQEKDQLSLPVIMPGERIPKFIAWPCPCKEPPSSNLRQAAAS